MSSYRQVKHWADDLRAAFGAAEIDAAMKQHGYMAHEGGKSVDTRRNVPGIEIAVTDMVIRLTEGSKTKRGARG